MKKVTKKREQRRQAGRRWLYAEALSVVVFVLLCLVMGMKLVHRRQIAKEEASAREEYQNAAVSVETAPSDTEQTPEIQPYFQHLLSQNKDTVGLLSFADMSLYVCQSDDNEYYRTHRFDGTEDAAGMIFMDARNSILPQSQNILLYGHNMKDGSRFGKLKRFEHADYLTENMQIRFSTLYESRNYRIISVFHTTTDVNSPDYFRYDIPDFPSEEAFNAYIAEVKRRSLYPNLTESAQYGDFLLTLSTCSSEMEDGLLVLVCKQVETDG